jgi:hypothetical protein
VGEALITRPSTAEDEEEEEAVEEAVAVAAEKLRTCLNEPRPQVRERVGMTCFSCFGALTRRLMVPTRTCMDKYMR